MKQYVIFSLMVVTFLLSSISASAVDGYKDLKFGATKAVILKNSGYSFLKSSVDQPGVEMYSCVDFKFGNKIVEAAALFVNNKFLRFVIVVPIDQIQGIVANLQEKYGAASSSSPQASFQAVDTHPNTEAFLAFDNNTIYLKISSDSNLIQSALLIYTSPDYDKHILATQKAGFAGDL